MTIPIAVQAALDHSEQEFASLMRDLGMTREQLNSMGREIRKTISGTKGRNPRVAFASRKRGIHV